MSYWLESPPTWRPTEAGYFASTAVGSSALALFARDREAFARSEQTEMTDAMLRGRVIDCWMLEPEHFAARYGLETGALRSAVDWGHRETTLVPETVLRAAAASVTALCGNAQALSLLCGPGLSQVCHRWTHPSGIEVRMRLDRAIMTTKGPDRLGDPGPGGFVDLKSWDVDPQRIESYICRWGAHRQAALYSQGYEDLWSATPHVVLVIVPPSGAWVESVPLSAKLLEIGRLDVDADLYAMAECRRTGDWSNPRSKTLKYAHPPRWVVIESERRHGE